MSRFILQDFTEGHAPYGFGGDYPGKEQSCDPEVGDGLPQRDQAGIPQGVFGQGEGVEVSGS